MGRAADLPTYLLTYLLFYLLAHLPTYDLPIHLLTYLLRGWRPGGRSCVSRNLAGPWLCFCGHCGPMLSSDSCSANSNKTASCGKGSCSLIASIVEW